MSQEWSQSPFRLSPAQDHTASRPSQLPTLSTHGITVPPSLPFPFPGAWMNTEQPASDAMDGLAMSSREDPLLSWHTFNDGLNSFSAAADASPHDSSSNPSFFLPPGAPSSFRNGILKAVHEIESGKMDAFLCLPPQPDEDVLLDETQGHMERLQPIRRTASAHGCVERPESLRATEFGPATGRRLPASSLARDTTFSLSTACSIHNQQSYSLNPGAAPGCYVPQPNRSSRPGSPPMLDMGAFSSVDFADDHNVKYASTEYQEYAELAAQLHANSMASTASMGSSPHMYGPGGSYSHLLAGSECDLACSIGPAPPPRHSAPQPRACFAPRHHLPFAPPPPCPDRLLTEPQPMQTSQSTGAAAQQGRLLRSASEGLASRTISAPHLDNRLGSCTSTDGPSNFKRLIYGQSDSGCQPSWAVPISPTMARCAAQQHPEQGTRSRPDCSDLLHDILDEHQAAAGNSTLGFAAPLLPADVCSSDDLGCAALQPSRALSTSRDAPSSSCPASHSSSPSKTQRKKISKHDLRKLFQYPIDDARKMMQVSKNAFKKTLLDCGFTGGWPQRQLVGLQKLMDNTSSDKSLTEETRKARLVRIKLNICALMDGDASTIYEDLQKASHVYHNRRHHERSTRRELKEPEPMASEEPSACP